MNKVLMATFGSSGDINPFLALGKSLKDRGAGVVCIINPADEEKFAEVGLETRHFGEAVEIPEILARRPQYVSLRGGELVLREIFIPRAGELLEETEKLIEELDPSVIVSHPLSFGSIWAAKRNSVSSVAVHFAPTSFFTRSNCSIYSVPKRILLRGLHTVMIRAANRWFRNVCRENNIRWHRDFFRDTLLKDDLVVALWDPVFRASQPDDPPNSVICGFPHPVISETLPPELDEFLDGGDLPVVFSLGSTAVHVSGKIYSRAVEVCRKLGRRGVLICGKNIPENLPETVLPVSYAPFHAVFPRCEAVVHHGGIGTCAESLRAGRPSVVIPFGHDQFDNAARLVKLGAGRKVCRQFATVRAIAGSLNRLLDSDAVRKTETLREEIAARGDGAARVADEILRL